MYTLSNDALTVSVLDPVADRVRLGTRYCTGGYIYMVEDHKLGPIVSGPAYPGEYPPVFDGQGLPEAFFDALSPEPDATPVEGQRYLVLGVGTVSQPAAPGGERRRELGEFCTWDVTRSDDVLTMSTKHSLGRLGATITREVLLVGRAVKSTTSLRNTGQMPITFRWFPHPFYPLVPSGEACRFNTPVGFPDNPGYALRADGMIMRKDPANWSRSGHFQMVDFQPRGNLASVLRHPTLGLTTVTCSYEPAYMPIWGNANTFSVEPYLQRTVNVGEETCWSVTYDF